MIVKPYRISGKSKVSHVLAISFESILLLIILLCYPYLDENLNGKNAMIIGWIQMYLAIGIVLLNWLVLISHIVVTKIKQRRDNKARNELQEKPSEGRPTLMVLVPKPYDIKISPPPPMQDS